MPIYEYRCGSCGEVFEYMQRMSDDPKTTCEKCQGKLERLISASAFHLKGGGWYKDLYASTKSDKASGSSDSSSPASSSDSSSSDSSSKSSSDSSSKSSSDSSSKSSGSSSSDSSSSKSSGSSGDSA